MTATQSVDNPALPCPLCCRIEIDQETFWADGAVMAYGIDGQFLPTIHRFTHPACDAAVTAMHVEQREWS